VIDPTATDEDLNLLLGRLRMARTPENRERLRRVLFDVWDEGYGAGQPELQVENPYRSV